MPDAKSGKRKLRAVARDLIEDFGDVIVFRSVFGADLFHKDGRVASRQLLADVIDDDATTTGPPQKTCTSSSLIDVGGLSVTGANGRVLIKLSEYVCRPGGRDSARFFSQPTIFVATPRSTSPFFMTSRHQLVDRQVEFEANDVEITAYAWDATGAAAANVPFSWRCLVAVDFVVT